MSSTCSDKLKPKMDQPNTIGFSLVEYNPPQRWNKQALQSTYELLRQRNIELDGTACNLYGTACKLMFTSCKLMFTSCLLMEPHASSENCMQAYLTACKLMELHANSWNCRQGQLHASYLNWMQDYVTASKLMELYARSQNCIQGHGTACKFM